MILYLTAVLDNVIPAEIPVLQVLVITGPSSNFMNMHDKIKTSSILQYLHYLLRRQKEIDFTTAGRLLHADETKTTRGNSNGPISVQSIICILLMFAALLMFAQLI